MVAQTVAPKPASANDDSNDTSGEITHLSPFVVTGESETGYSGQQTLIGSRTAKNLIDIPANITILNKELLDDLNVVNVSQAVRFGVSGVTQNTTINDDYNIRGFRTEMVMRNGVTKAANRSNPMYDVGRVEVIKGPAAMLLGNNSFLGGAINLVSIQPSAARSTEIKTTLSENNYIRVAANTTGPLFKSNDVSAQYRFTVGGLTGDREKEAEDLDQKFIGAGFNVFFGERSSLRVNAYYFKDDSYLYLNDFIDITSTTYAKFNQYSTESFSPARRKNEQWQSEDSFLDLQYLAKLSENGDIRFYYSGTSIREHRRHVRGITVGADNYTLTRQDIPLYIERVNHNLQLDYIYRFVSDWAKIDSTIGVDGAVTYSRQSQAVNTPPPLDTRSVNFAADDVYFSTPQPGAGLPYQTDTASRPTLVSYYFQENVSLLKDRLTLVGGLRWFIPAGTNKNYITNVITDRDPRHFKVHKYGVIVKVLPTLSAYYTNAQNVFVQTGFADKVVSGDQLGAPAGNQEGQLDEFGLKFNHQVNENVNVYGTLARFDMALTNVKTVGTLPSGNVGQIISKQDESNGWEFDAGLSVKVGSGRADFIFAYFDGDSSTAVNPALQAENFAPRKYSALAKYRWTGGSLKGLMIGGALMDQSAKRNITYQVESPLIVSLFGGYSWDKWNVQVNLDNVTNERYIVALAATGLAYGSDTFQPRLEVGYKW
ncbi:MAG: TonB-dependent receptor [Opitutaceae bacterium]|nr:TonB-dependent receptor [Opitutaceae bacterium]